jgi:putative ATP-dependent DNA ligase
MKLYQEVYDEEFIDLLSKALTIPKSKIISILKKGVLQKISVFIPDHYRFNKGVSGFESGTAVIKVDNYVEIIGGFPKIPRAMVLEPAINKQFNGLPTVAIEEKMNGYNVRIASINGRIIALTRGGLMCPYTTEKVIEQISSDFFIDHPNMVLCGEMVGPDNPYVPKDIYHEVESISFFIFDIKEKKTGRSVTIHERHKLCSCYNLKAVPYFGEYKLQDAYRIVTNKIKELGEIDHEGVIIKDPEMKRSSLKYTCSKSTNNDLKYAFEFYNDYGRDFFFSRVVREGFQSVEWNEDDAALCDRCCRLGESILIPMVKTINKLKKNERITEDVRIRVRSLETARQFETHLKRMGIDAKFEEPQHVDGEFLITIKKFNQSTNDRTAALLDGQLW